MGEMMKRSLSELAGHIGAVVEGDEEHLITGVAELELAENGQLTFADSAHFVDQVSEGNAGGVVVGSDFPSVPGKNLLRVDQPRLAFLRIVELYMDPVEPLGIHPRACVEQGVELGEGVGVGACAVVSSGALIGPGTQIHAGAYIASGVVVGRDCLIEANVTLLSGVILGDRVVIHAGATIGGEGFGFLWKEDHYYKFPQIGGVRLDDDVEIGCNSCVDRAALGVTVIGRGTKIDNLVQIGHNSQIGQHVVMSGQVGTAGSARIGDRTMIGGQSAISDHVTVGEGAVIAGAAGVTKEVPAGETVMGIPARPMRRVQREYAALARLPELLKAFRQQAKEVEALKRRLEAVEREA